MGIFNCHIWFLLSSTAFIPYKDHFYIIGYGFTNSGLRLLWNVVNLELHGKTFQLGCSINDRSEITCIIAFGKEMKETSVNGLKYAFVVNLYFEHISLLLSSTLESPPSPFRCWNRLKHSLFVTDLIWRTVPLRSLSVSGVCICVCVRVCVRACC